jgi:3-phenylpropionate/cinnamic acid dioxygenase small subunit
MSATKRPGDHVTSEAQHITDELAIRNLIARIAHLADHGEGLDEYLACFAPDAAWNFPVGSRVGHESILAGAQERRASGTTGPGSNSRHLISTIEVAVDGSDEATSDAYFVFLVETNETPRIFNCGHYHDTWRRTADGWKLAVRDIVLG